MATKTFYPLVTTATTPNWFGVMQDGGTAPTTASAAYGWTVGTTAAPAFFRAFLGATTKATTTQGTTYIGATSGPTKGTGATNVTSGDCFITPAAYTGTFANTAWTFNWILRGGTVGAIGLLNMRVWASVNADGTSARELTSGLIPGATVTLTTSSDVNSSISWSPGSTNVNNEFLYFQLEWKETTTGAASSDVKFRIGSTCFITTPDLGALVAGGPFDGILGPPFDTKTYRDTGNYYCSRNGILPGIIQTQSSTFLNFIENAAPFNSISYRDTYILPDNPNLYQGAVNPFVNTWTGRGVAR